jgi:hypothetical protein
MSFIKHLHKASGSRGCKISVVTVGFGGKFELPLESWSVYLWGERLNAIKRGNFVETLNGKSIAELR